MLNANVHGISDRDHVGDALDRALGALEWDLQASRRSTLAAHEQLDTIGEGPGFLYILNGMAEIRTGAMSTDVAEGDFLLFSHGIRRQIRARTDIELINVTFAPPARKRPAVETLPDAMVVRQFDEREPAMVGLIESMACGPALASKFTRAGDGVICSRIAVTIVSAAVRAWSELGCAPERWRQRVIDPHLVHALDALHADLRRPWTVESLARVAAMSRSGFAERFRAAMGQSPAAYLTAVRMDAAADLLIREHASVAEVARRLGYESEAGFSRAFRRHIGSTPSRWRLGVAAPVQTAV
ncbi:AraC family transcriptional regulator [Rhodococcus sp. G-MC3]|uniref:helix-turn-helix transcriptional regulator n=1 Tax=Rhodococcus sp. G-MC3 TaxID=3046209 RepID=UPI0024BB2E07|nr:AraC family transcriptional regulator [Rhodococcus sp. G-MC3]MDJ0396037.1 AraC family transcriptional regulator [Rhodococcus sp. G-MC3]